MEEIKSSSEIKSGIEFKAGLEIHQQLDTHKLFCKCPSVLRSDEPEFEVRRRLHAVAGESGEIDVAVKHEVEKDKEFVYQGYDSTCLVELDEEPPHLINSEALRTGLHVAMLLNCEILPIAQIMRKTVVDGSNTSGFQRTVLIARNGWVETSLGRVEINALLLEEDSARPSSDLGDENIRIWKLDRLGVPMLEIATEPDIKNPEHAKETALLIGDILRSCKVKRGIGTIRQDVNISIEGHPRVEIKGFQDPKMMIKTVELEVERQKENLKNKKNLGSEVRGALPDGTSKFLRPMPGAARMYPETDLPLLRISREIINNAKESLPKLRSEIKGELRDRGLSDEMISLFSKGDKVEEFMSLSKMINDPNFIARVLFLIPREIAKHKGIENIDDVLNLDIIEGIVEGVVRGVIGKEDVKHVMEEIVKGKSLEEAIQVEKLDLSEVESFVAKLVRERQGLSVGGYMGLVMKEFKGKVSGGEVMEILEKLV